MRFLRWTTLVAFIFTSISSTSVAQNPSAVPVDPVRLERIQDFRRVTGDIRARQRSEVAAQEQGRVVEFEVREGERVEAEQVLAKLDPVRLAIEVDAIVAQLAVAKAVRDQRSRELEQMQTDLETLRELARENATNPKEVADAEFASGIAEARLQQALSDLDQINANKRLLEKRLSDLEIRAPFSGVVIRRHTEIGQWVSAGSPIVTLISDHRLEAWLSIPQTFLRSLGKGSVRVEIDATKESFHSKDVRLIADVDPSGRNFQAVVTVPRLEGTAPGMSLTAWIPTGVESEYLTIAHDAILRNNAGAFVYAVREGSGGQPSTVMAVPIEVLFIADGRAIVRDGLVKEGMRVVVEGNERLFPGAPISPFERATKGGDEDSESGPHR